MEWNQVSMVSDQQVGPFPTRPMPSYTTGYNCPDNVDIACSRLSCLPQTHSNILISEHVVVI